MHSKQWTAKALFSFSSHNNALLNNFTTVSKYLPCYDLFSRGKYFVHSLGAGE